MDHCIMTRIPFTSYLRKHVVLFDGAMGTLLYQRGVFIDKCYDELNLSNPEQIQSIHRDYLEAGAAVIETNTFGANRYKLGRYNLSDQTEIINFEGARIAKEIAGDKQYVAGSVGPLGIQLEPWGETSRMEAREAFQQQAEALIKGGVDLFNLETFHDINEMEEAIAAVRSVGSLPVIAQMTIQDDGKTSYGLELEEMVRRFTNLRLDALGINCTLGPKRMLDFLEQMVKMTTTPIAIMPNAGMPQRVDGRMFYMATPEYFGVYAKRFIETGARIVGGCCGTTPEHIKKMAEAILQKQGRIAVQIQVKTRTRAEVSILQEEVPQKEKSQLASKIAQGDYVTLVEMISPRGKNIEKQLDSAQKLKSEGIDAINIPDGPRASARMNGLALAVLLQNHAGIETVMHYTCRDRNLLGIQSDLLGASVLGVRNILAITGDPPLMGDYPQSTAVFDIDSIGLTHILHNLNHGLDIGNKHIGEPTGFFIGVGVDPNSMNLTREIQRFHGKVAAGAEFAITQPVFDLDALKRFIEKVKDFRIPFIVGIWPLASLRNAEFMKYEVPGVTVPDSIIRRMEKFDAKDDQLKVGIEIAQEMASHVRKISHGIQISAPLGRYEVALEVAKIVQKELDNRK